ncbi:MAG: SpoIIE family protein phosphatase [Pirellulales bacterium]|nr:SpoIIE family protein phosphatase [Pirellulales bacterium]
MEDRLTLSNVILDSLSDGVYVCDRDRRIVYWSKSAERITGWMAEDVVGRRCLDDVLCHADKDGHQLCGEEFCPLHRSIVTGTASVVPLIVFARGKKGSRIPMQVAVSPIRDADGQVVGGVESFRDMSVVLTDLEKAQRIQALSLEHDLPEDPRVRFSTFYMSHDIVGGDFYALRQLDEDHYGFILADVMGHGVSAALYTMHLSSLWEQDCSLLASPAEFAQVINRDLARVVKDESFATALCGMVDAKRRTLRFASAGGPPILVVHPDGSMEQLESSGLPFGMLEEASYDEVSAGFEPGTCLLLFSDGAVEIHNAEGAMLGAEGLVRILTDLGYPRKPIDVDAVEEALLRFSNAIRLEDDLTLLEVRFS